MVVGGEGGGRGCACVIRMFCLVRCTSFLSGSSSSLCGHCLKECITVVDSLTKEGLEQ